MSKKHFEALALELALAREGLDFETVALDGWGQAVKAVANACQLTNPRFSREKFLEACETWETEFRDGKLCRKK